MAGVRAKVTVPAPAGPCLENHRHGFASHHLAGRTELFEERLECDLGRGLDSDFFEDLDGLDPLLRDFRRHLNFSLSELAVPGICSFALSSASSLILSSWWSQKRSNFRTHS